MMKHPEPCQPNIVLIMADDLGFADIDPYRDGSDLTPNLNRFAREGLRFINFYAGSSVCSPSRAALLTGCYPHRVGIEWVLGPRARKGLHPAEQTLPELLRDAGYRTALFGKWHLGNYPPHFPLKHGFETWFGTVGSNDMSRKRMTLAGRARGEIDVELMQDDRLVEVRPDQGGLTQRYGDRAIEWIERHAGREPVFLLLAPNMPHTPLFAGKLFEGSTGRGLYADVIAELDHMVGRVMRALEDTGIDEQTLVIFTSDNGPWLIFGNHGGRADPLRGGKKQLFDGGVRVPCLMRWPGVIPPGQTCRGLASFMDLLPTLTGLAGASRPRRRIDGLDLGGLLRNPDSKSPRMDYLYYFRDELHAIRMGRWKLQFPHVDREAPDPDRLGMDGRRGKVMAVEHGRALYDLEADPHEQVDVSAQNPRAVRDLSRRATAARRDLGDSLCGIPGAGLREPATMKAADAIAYEEGLHERIESFRAGVGGSAH